MPAGWSDTGCAEVPLAKVLLSRCRPGLSGSMAIVSPNLHWVPSSRPESQEPGAQGVCKEQANRQ